MVQHSGDMRLVQIILGLLCFMLTATWAWTLHIHGRLVACEVQDSTVVEDISEIKADVKELRTAQTQMWKDLRDRMEGKYGRTSLDFHGN